MKTFKSTGDFSGFSGFIYKVVIWVVYYMVKTKKKNRKIIQIIYYLLASIFLIIFSFSIIDAVRDAGYSAISLVIGSGAGLVIMILLGKYNINKN